MAQGPCRRSASLRGPASKLRSCWNWLRSWAIDIISPGPFRAPCRRGYILGIGTKSVT